MKDKYFTRKVSENFLCRGSWLWVGRVTGNDNIFCPALGTSLFYNVTIILYEMFPFRAVLAQQKLRRISVE